MNAHFPPIESAKGKRKSSGCDLSWLKRTQPLEGASGRDALIAARRARQTAALQMRQEHQGDVSPRIDPDEDYFTTAGLVFAQAGRARDGRRPMVGFAYAAEQ